MRNILPLIPRAIRQSLRSGSDLFNALFPTICQQTIADAFDQGFRLDDSSDYCPRCAATIREQAVTSRGCPFCLHRRLPWERVVRLGPYQPPLAEWIIAMKFRHEWIWAEWFGRQLAGAIGDSSPGPCVVCPVPMHFRRRFMRGYNQSELIAAELARRQGWLCVPLLNRRRYNAPQTQTIASKRKSNVRGTFALGSFPIRGCEVWLVDDVKTTGATLEACAKLLRRAGAARVNLAVIAATDPHGHQFTRIATD